MPVIAKISLVKDLVYAKRQETQQDTERAQPTTFKQNDVPHSGLYK
jgi:hypothetical protein